jgi:ActR/RegA family two-component response regulator
MNNNGLFFLDADGRLVGPESAPFPGEARALNAALAVLRSNLARTSQQDGNRGIESHLVSGQPPMPQPPMPQPPDILRHAYDLERANKGAPSVDCMRQQPIQASARAAGRTPRHLSRATPAQIMMVHDDAAFTHATGRALVERGYEVMIFPDPLAALTALETADRVELVITRVQFPVGRSNGAALALMARQKRPDVKVLFVCRPSFRRHVYDLGCVLATPVTASQIVEAVTRLLRTPDTAADAAPRPFAESG